MKINTLTHLTTVHLCLLTICLVLITSCAGSNNTTQSAASESSTLTKEQMAQEKKHIFKKIEETLAELYRLKPEAKKAVESAYGYAVFSNTGYNVVLYVGGKGKGVAFRNSDKKPIFMTMLNAGTGPGVGYTEYRQILIFDSKYLFDQFTTVGLNASASANATIKLGDANIDESGVVALMPGVSAYHINDKGVDIQANWGGMKYFKDSDFNK
jgi:lipid-binding SYLF domain-containing protein